MNILILGGDGYLGWATAMHLSARGHAVTVADNYLKRRLQAELDLPPLADHLKLGPRAELWKAVSGHAVAVAEGDLNDYPFLVDLLGRAAPDAIVHYAEQPSAPYSMMGQPQAALTIVNNVQATLNVIWAIREAAPSCHLVKLGTMGEYGTPNIDIEEGYIDIEHNGRKDRMLFPKTPGSIYHLSKVQDSDLLYFACRTWSLAVTDLNQGPVYGVHSDESAADDRLIAQFCYDDVFGTVLNRFAAQAVAGVPLTVYGKGGQVRGYLNIKDTLQCVDLALRSPAAPGTFRVFNQFTETFTVNELADRVQQAGKILGLDVRVDHIPNPRKELEEHYYNPKNTSLMDLGLEPHLLSRDVLANLLDYVRKNQSRLDRSKIMPRVRWGN